VVVELAIVVVGVGAAGSEVVVDSKTTTRPVSLEHEAASSATATRTARRN
jgi:hypothetical protein